MDRNLPYRFLRGQPLKWLSARYYGSLGNVENAWRGRVVWERVDFTEIRWEHFHIPYICHLRDVHGRFKFAIGVFSGTAEVDFMVCPKHRDTFGIKWRGSKKICQVPEGVASQRSKNHTGDRTISRKLSEEIFNRTGSLIPIGSGIQLYYFSLLEMLH